MVIFVTIALLAAGLYLLIRGWRPPRQGDEPRCRKCEYILTGMTSDRCPECGTELVPTNIVHGQRKRNGIKVAWGLAIILIVTMAVIQPYVVNIEWYQYMPARWVFKDLQSADNVIVDRAWLELNRRLKDGKLSDAHRHRLIAIALDAQAATGAYRAQEFINLLGQKVEDGLLDPAEQERFFQQMLTLTLEARPTVIVGNRVPLRTSHTAKMPSRNWWCRIEHTDRHLDGEYIGKAGFTTGGMGSGTGISSLQCSAVGSHVIQSTYKVEIFTGLMDQEQSSKLHFTESVILSDTFTVLETTPDNLIEIIDDPKLLPQVQASIQPLRFRALRGNPKTGLGWQLNGIIDIKNPPVDVAFTISARAGDKEYILAQNVSVLQGKSMIFGLNAELEPNVSLDKVDLIFRSSEEAVHATIDQNRLWKGDIVFKDVRVTRPRPPPRKRSAGDGIF